MEGALSFDPIPFKFDSAEIISKDGFENGESATVGGLDAWRNGNEVVCDLFAGTCVTLDVVDEIEHSCDGYCHVSRRGSGEFKTRINHHPDAEAYGRVHVSL